MTRIAMTLVCIGTTVLQPDHTSEFEMLMSGEGWVTMYCPICNTNIKIAHGFTIEDEE